MLVAWSAIALTGSTAMSYFSYIVRHDLQPTFERLFDIYFLPPAGPAFWAMNFSILAIALTAFAARAQPPPARAGAVGRGADGTARRAARSRSSPRRACWRCRRRSTRISC